MMCLFFRWAISSPGTRHAQWGGGLGLGCVGYRVWRYQEKREIQRETKTEEKKEKEREKELIG